MSLQGDPITIGPITMQWVQVYFARANDDVPVQHGCPGRFVEASVAWKDKFCDIRGSQMPPASNVVLLVSDTDGVTATIRIVTLNLAER